MTAKTRLELTWIGKDVSPRPEPRILLEVPDHSHRSQGESRGGLVDHRVIHGDNLLALKALEQDFTGRIKCIYIDPPYNTGSAFPSYDDGLEHSQWLTMMRDRLVILWRLLSPANGVLLISINDDEAHYLKVLCDELFGRDKFVANLVWNYEGNTDNQAKIIRYHEYVLVYSTTGQIDDPRTIDPTISTDSKLHRNEIRNTVIKNGPKNPPKAVALPAGFPASFVSGKVAKSDVQWPRYSSDLRVAEHRLTAAVTATSGWSSREILEDFIASGFKPVKDSKGQETIFELRPTGAIEAVKVRKQDKGHVVSVLRGFGTTNQMRLLLDKIGVKFSYPKPVGLIAYLISAFSGDDDIVLDSFAGSGTTGHAILKLNRETGSKRRFILVELSERTVYDVTLPRLRAVIDGDRRGDLEPHGGGFRFYRLAPSLLERDPWGNWVISKQYNPAMLSEAVCKHEGFRYAPSSTVYWQHGRSTETDFIYVTTQTLTREQLEQISHEVGSKRTLLICCGAFRVKADAFANLTIKKIPNAVLHRCEWGHDDYSLAISQLGEAALSPSDTSEASRTASGKKPSRSRSKNTAQTLPLFREEK